MSISETKIDSSYPNAQLSISGYSLYRNDRKKGGGGVTALASSLLTKKIVGAPGPKNVRFVPPRHRKGLTVDYCSLISPEEDLIVRRVEKWGR